MKGKKHPTSPRQKDLRLPDPDLAELQSAAAEEWKDVRLHLLEVSRPLQEEAWESYLVWELQEEKRR